VGPATGTASLLAPLAAGTLDPQGPGARPAAELWWLMLWLGTAVFVLFAVLLVAAIVRGRGGERSLLPEDRRLVGRWIVTGGVVLPAVVIVVVFWATLSAMRDTPAVASSDALRVEIVGHQFWYEIRYPDEGIVTANELHIPVGREVSLELRSGDVVHSFWVPELGGKVDMLPERTNTLILSADEPGEYPSRCAEFCGIQHARMGMLVVASEAEEFDAWVAEQRRAAEPAGEEARRGREIFVQADCTRCHAPPGRTATDATAPDLTNVAARRLLAGGVLENTPENLARWITEPQEIKPGVDMPATELTGEELDALLAYLGARR
jgi:cytochrome c oxidase subunit II